MAITPASQATDRYLSAAEVTISRPEWDYAARTVRFWLNTAAASSQYKISVDSSYNPVVPSSAGGYGSVTFPAGVNAATLTITALDNPPSSAYVSIDLASFSGSGYQVAESSSYATVTLQDVWSVPVDLSSSANPATNDDSVTISATLPADPAAAPALRRALLPSMIRVRRNWAPQRWRTAMPSAMPCSSTARTTTSTWVPPRTRPSTSR